MFKNYLWFLDCGFIVLLVEVLFEVLIVFFEMNLLILFLFEDLDLRIFFIFLVLVFSLIFLGLLKGFIGLVIFFNLDLLIICGDVNIVDVIIAVIIDIAVIGVKILNFLFILLIYFIMFNI